VKIDCRQPQQREKDGQGFKRVLLHTEGALKFRMTGCGRRLDVMAAAHLAYLDAHVEIKDHGKDRDDGGKKPAQCGKDRHNVSPLSA